MKLNRHYLFIAISSVALLVVLVIQVNWIFETARINEELFNEKANMVLSRTADALNADKQTRQKIETCVGRDEARKIDSLLKHYMKFYNFQMGYYFEWKLGSTAELYDPVTSKNSCRTSLDDSGNAGGLQLKLIFPEKEEFIIAEMGTQFITSVALILIVLVLFWRTILSLLKEKKISEHTTDFLNNMTHEFKTPLTNIALAGKMIIKESVIKQEDKIKHYSGIILEENEKLKQQVEQVLGMTELERGEIPLLKTEVDIHQLIDDSLKCMSIQIDNKEGTVNVDLGAEQSVVMADKTHLTNAFCNLIDNAIKYAREELELSIQTANIGNNLVVVFSDKGIGIEKEYQKKVFEKFFRVPTGDVHDVKGFGLGLAYVKKIIELHKGTIEIRSEKGDGTKFTITIPNVKRAV
jgi:two-component system phosphate regulon sensor histidine kinase PhoR